MEAKLHAYESMGQRYKLIVENVVTGVEELPNLMEVVGLVETTLDKMYIEQKALETALPP